MAQIIDHSRVYESSTTCSDRFGANLGVTGCALPLLDLSTADISSFFKNRDGEMPQAHFIGLVRGATIMSKINK